MQQIQLTEGAITQQLLRFSLPMIAGNLLQQVYHLADTLMVGRCIGADALACVGSAYTLMVFLTSVISGLCMGSGAFFSADFGKGDHDALFEDSRLSFWFIFAVTVGLMSGVIPGQHALLRLLQTPPELMALTSAYVSVVFWGMGFVFLYNFCATLLRAVGNSAIPLWFLSVSVVLNILLDALFIVRFQGGVAGAAWATVLSQAVAGIGIAGYTLRKCPFLRHRGSSRRSLARLREIAAGDLSTAAQQSVMNFGILMIQGLVNSFGAVVMASFAAAVKIDTLAYMPAQEFGNAYSLFVSQNFGAGKDARIRQGTRIAFAISATFCAAASVGIVLFAPTLLQLFVDAEEQQILAEGVRYLRIEGAAYIGIGMLFLWYGYFRGIQKPRLSLLLTVLSLGTRVVLSYLLAPHTPLGVIAIWCSIPIGWALADVAGLWLYRKV